MKDLFRRIDLMYIATKKDLEEHKLAVPIDHPEESITIDKLAKDVILPRNVGKSVEIGLAGNYGEYTDFIFVPPGKLGLIDFDILIILNGLGGAEVVTVEIVADNVDLEGNEDSNSIVDSFDDDGIYETTRYARSLLHNDMSFIKAIHVRARTNYITSNATLEVRVVGLQR